MNRRAERVRMLETKSKSIFLRCCPISVGDVLMQTVEVVNDFNLRGLQDICDFVVQMVDYGESILANLPVAVAAVLPFGEVAGSDGVAFKVFFEDSLDFREGIEPFENGLTLFAVVKTAIELFTDVVRETSDFSGTHGFLQF